jgi:hypothetical protein
MKTFEIIVTRTSFEACSLNIEADSLTQAKAAAIAECEADEEGEQEFDWIISSGAEFDARDSADDGSDDEKPETRVNKIETAIRAGNYEPGESAVCDLLADLRHYCDANKYDFPDIDKVAYMHYVEEKQASS